MYARKYYLIIYRNKSSAWIYIEANLLPEYTRGSHQQYIRAYHQPIVFLRKVTFDLLTFLPFAANIIFIKFTSFTIHFVHLFTFTFSPFHLLSFPLSPPLFPLFSLLSFSPFLSSSSPFPHLTPPSSIPLYLTTSGTKTEKIRDNSFISRKNVLTLQP